MAKKKNAILENDAAILRDEGHKTAAAKAETAAGGSPLEILAMAGGNASAIPGASEHKAGVTYDPRQLIKTYLPGASDDIVDALVTELRGHEKEGGPEYHTALSQLVQGNSQLQDMTPLGRALKKEQPGSQGIDPLAYQAFFSQSVAPYLNQIADQTQATTAPLYKQLQSHLGGLPGNYGSVLGAAIPTMQIGEANTMAALRGSAASAPGLDAIIKNSQMAQQAALKSYYESIAARSSGGTGGTTIDPALAKALAGG